MGCPLNQGSACADIAPKRMFSIGVKLAGGAISNGVKLAGGARMPLRTRDMQDLRLAVCNGPDHDAQMAAKSARKNLTVLTPAQLLSLG